MAKRKTILDLNETINRSMGQRISKKDRERLKKLKKRRENQIQANKQAGEVKKNIRKKGEKLGWSEKKIKAEQAKEFVFPLKDIDNQLNRIGKKPFLYVIRDRFNKPYKIKAADIAKKDVTEFILKKMADGIQRAINKTPREDKKRRTQLSRLRDKVLYNLQIYKSGAEKFSQKELNKQDIKYPLLSDIYEETILII